MKRPTLILTAVIAAAVLVSGCGGSGSNSKSSGNGHVNIVMWHGYTETEAVAIKKLAAEFNASHPNITVSVQSYGNSDYALQKVLAAIAGGKPPDISYLYGSWAPNIATNPGVVTLNKLIAADPSFNWNDFYTVERQQATVDGKIVGVPALVDNLALVYNKKLFAQAGLSRTDGELDLDRFRERCDEAHRPGQEAVRVGLRQRCERGHGLALLGDAVAGGRARSCRPTASMRRSTHLPVSKR